MSRKSGFRPGEKAPASGQYQQIGPKLLTETAADGCRLTQRGHREADAVVVRLLRRGVGRSGLAIGRPGTAQGSVRSALRGVR